ncbi:MAG: SPOR domain-containing protein [Zoogloeaceae bacterium]|nr:SPOR domain-containing protein [Zoogloeaceae bacterium]MCK6383725.1 SPOR domain-containing protein [Rhodocyclaceae bacterium]
MSENDAQLELKKRARRRLVGAAALAVLAAVVLPMVMDQAPRQQAPAQDIQIRIPAQDAGAFTSRILPVKPGSVPTPLPPAVVEAKPAAEPANQEARPEAAKPQPKAEPKPAPAKVSPANTASKPPEPRATAAIDEKLLARKAEVAPIKPAAGGEAWIVQLGAYRAPANVRNLTAKVGQQGYNFYTEVLPSPDGSSRTRVRAGPFPSKEAAEAARERIKRIGVDGVVAQQ